MSALCFAHLRWNFVYQRPQHVMTRLAETHDVFYFEEPEFSTLKPTLKQRREGNVVILTPCVPAGTSSEDLIASQRYILDEFLESRSFSEPPLLWYYTPMALPFTRHLQGLRVYDCMDELKAFKDAPAEIALLERELMSRCDVVFTGGRSLYHAKRRLNPNVFCLPSAVDADHFAPRGRSEPSGLNNLARPRMIFCGVIDERLDVQFVEALAGELSDWSLIFVGPTAKIDPAILPQAPNLHYTGLRRYDELPAYLEHCDVALLPFALNDATRFISPTKTLEYLAARKSVISTPIADVVDPYGRAGIVDIAANVQQAATLARQCIRQPRTQQWHRAVDRILGDASWDGLVANMRRRIDEISFEHLQVAG